MVLYCRELLLHSRGVEAFSRQGGPMWPWLKIPTSPRLVQSLLGVMEGPHNIPGATPHISPIFVKKVLYGFCKQQAADREADTPDKHHHQTCSGWILRFLEALGKVLWDPQIENPHEHGSCCMSTPGLSHGQSIGLAMALLLMGAHQTCSRFPQASPLG